MEKYYSFKNQITNTIIIKKSEFITNLINVTTEDEITTTLKAIKKKYYDATHNCYAYIIGTQADIKYKASDDGEPSKTAGAPILDCLQKNNLTNCLCVVTRYFGGIKLGAGGLTRAYSDSASEAIKLITDLEEIIEKKLITIQISYELLSVITKAMAPYTLINKTFAESITLTYEVPLHIEGDVIKTITNITNGKAIFPK